mgnify:CR=1 FL=1
MADTAKAIDALHSIPPDLPRDEWVRVGMAAHAAGLDFDTFDAWSAGAGNYDAAASRDVWKSIKPGKGIGPGTLYRVGAEHGWRMGEGKPQQRPMQAPKKAAEPPRKPAPGMSPAEVWARCEAATAAHGYIVAKAAAGVPLCLIAPVEEVVFFGKPQRTLMDGEVAIRIQTAPLTAVWHKACNWQTYRHAGTTIRTGGAVGEIAAAAESAPDQFFVNVGPDDLRRHGHARHGAPIVQVAARMRRRVAELHERQGQIGVISAPICAFCRRSLGGFSIVSVQPCPLFSDSGSKVGQTRCARTHANSAS